MAVDARRIRELFGTALEIADTKERQLYLDRECGKNVELRQRLDALLKAHDAPASALQQPLVGEGTGAYVSSEGAAMGETPGTLIAGKYKLLQQIGEGGMGSVWMADQTEPVKRRVAVKLIRTERGSSKTILARFEAERQAIALMDHPHIAKLLDAGTTENEPGRVSAGSPFFVMELVKGVPLTEFCDTHKLSIPDRLSLFMQICSAVQHAHQKGIIHRDLKPSNILVELHDDKPVPKVIDFGLAKATSGIQLTENTLFTGFGTVAGTPLYMAPEQANFNAVDIDTRADIYALGVILYELLTGTTPISRETIKRAALDEMMKMIREEEAPTPSSRLSSSETKPTVAANRHTEPVKLGRYIKGELDWIVMKALSKERDRRYETANGFAKDIERFLNHEAVLAGPVSAGYRLKKFVARNKGKVIAAGIFLGLLLAGIAGTSFGLFQANRAADAERQAKQEAITAATNEKAANAQAQVRLKQIEKGNAVLMSIFEDLDMSKVKGQKEPLEAVLAKRLIHAAKQLEKDAIGDAVVMAELQYTLGRTLISLGYNRDAIPLFLKARETLIAKYGLEDQATIMASHGLAQAYLKNGDMNLALPLLEENLRLAKKLSGNEHYLTVVQLGNLAVGYLDAGKIELALPLMKEALKLRKKILGDEHQDTLASMSLLAQGYRKAGQVALALPLAEEAYRLRKQVLGAEHKDTLNSLQELAGNLRDAGKYELALPLYEEAYSLKKLKLGIDHPDTLEAANNLALVCVGVGKPIDIAFLEETLKLSTNRLGVDDSITIRTMANLATGYRSAGRHDQALPLFEKALKLSQEKQGKDHPATITFMSYLGEGYSAAGKHDMSLPLLIKALKLSQEINGLDHSETIHIMIHLADGYWAAGKPELGIEQFEKTLKIQKEKRGANHPDTYVIVNKLGAWYWQSKRLDKSIPLQEEHLKYVEQTLGRSHRNTIIARYNLGLNYRDAGRLAEAIPLLMEVDRDTKEFPDRKNYHIGIFFAYSQADMYQQAIAIIPECLPTARAELPKESPQLAEALVQFSQMYLQAKCYTEAITLLREALAIRERTQPDVWTTFNTKSMLGGALLGLKKIDEAEPLLLAGYEGMKQRQKSIPPHGMIRVPMALDRLIQLYTETNKPDEVKKWQVEKDKLPKPVEKK